MRDDAVVVLPKPTHRVRTTIAATLILLVLAAMVGIVKVGLGRQEIYECDVWKEQAAEYSNFYLLRWQRDQCNAHGITFDATVI